MPGAMTGFPAPQDVQAAFASVVVDEWVRAGVREAVACPGSRSTPLLVALGEASERGALRLHVLADERAAGFFALGLGMAAGMPAPVVTTSGTAAAELHPAVVEAYHAGVPMIAVTADRPPELQDFGAPQTITQGGLFGKAVRWEAAPGVPDLGAAWSWRSLASRSVHEARGSSGRPGPVHLNLAFREPLLGSPAAVLEGGVDSRATGTAMGQVAIGTAGGQDPRRGLELMRRGRPDGAPWHSWRGDSLVPPPPDAVDALAGAGERGLIVAGAGAGDPEAVWQLCRATGWPVLATPQSGARSPGAIGSADALLRTAVVRGWRPEVVLRLGAPWASRVVNEWLAGLDTTQVLVDPAGWWATPDRPPGEVVVASPELVCRAVAERVRPERLEKAGGAGEWARLWSRAESLAQEAIDTALAGETGVTEPALARGLLADMPAGGTVFVSSSMPVREVEWWSRPRHGVRVLANRGANGIDGVLSTALGVAAGSSGRLHNNARNNYALNNNVTALVGDLAFLYDASVLLAAHKAGFDLDVVVVDNDGGGIFSFLPQAMGQPPERFERLWGTPHRADVAAVARAYGAAVEEVADINSLAGTMARPGPGQGLRVFVARTDRAENVAVHNLLNAAVEKAVERLGA